MAKTAKEKFKTYQNVLDEFTIRTLFKLITQGHFDGIESPISIGKEANIFSAKKKSRQVILKIYRLETSDFNRMYDYIRHDPRFMDVKKQKRKVIFAWAQREFRNLMKIRHLGVRVPTPVTFLNNVLVMEFIGDKEAAPKLKDEQPKNTKKFFDRIIEYMKLMYEAGYVHTDLSHFNILNYKDHPVFIDLSQCTTKGNPKFDEYLERDVKNVVNYFNKIGLKINEKLVLEEIKK